MGYLWGPEEASLVHPAFNIIICICAQSKIFRVNQMFSGATTHDSRRQLPTSSTPAAISFPSQCPAASRLYCWNLRRMSVLTSRFLDAIRLVKCYCITILIVVARQIRIICWPMRPLWLEFSSRWHYQQFLGMSEDTHPFVLGILVLPLLGYWVGFSTVVQRVRSLSCQSTLFVVVCCTSRWVISDKQHYDTH